MGKIWILILILDLLVFQVTKNDFDKINGCSFYIKKAALNQEIKPIIKACEINSLELAEKLFGKCNQSDSYKSILFNENQTSIFYIDGLSLIISNDLNNLFTFSITSNKYALVLENGTEIKTGMALHDFKKLFPKSYAQKSKIMYWAGQEGNTQIIVYFSFIKDNEVIAGDSWIIFVFDKETNQLTQFRSYIPG